MGSLVGANAAAATIRKPHIVLSAGFDTFTQDWQSALMIHEMLHVVIGDHLEIDALLEIPEAYLFANGGNFSFVLTQFIRNDCPKPTQ